MVTCMKVLYLNTYDTKGGAAIACYRLNEAMQQYTDVSTQWIVNQKSSDNDEIVNLSDGWIGDKKAKGRLGLEKLLFLFHEKSKDVRFDFSTASTGVDIADHPLVLEADIIHMHWINQGFLSLKGIEKLAQTGKPIIWTLHDMWAMTGGCHNPRGCDHYLQQCGNCPFLRKPSSNDLSHKIWNRKREIYNQMNLTVITPSQWLGGRAKESGLLAEQQILNIPNTLSNDIFYPSDQKDARKKLGLPENKLLLTFIAEIPSKPAKGFYYLKKGLQLLAERNSTLKDKVELLIIGNVKDDVFRDFPFPLRFSGYIDSSYVMTDYYRAATLFLLPSLEENLPNTLMEAMACGTPAVAFNTGGIPEMINHKDNGYLAEYKSAEDLANGILWCLQGDHRLKKLSNEAIAKFKNTYDPEVIARQHQELYESLTPFLGEIT